MLADAPTEHIVAVKWDVPPIPAPSQMSVPVGTGAPAVGDGGGGGAVIPGLPAPAVAAAAIATAATVLAHRSITDFKSLEEAQFRMQALGDLSDAEVDQATAASQEIGAGDWSRFDTVDAMGAIDMLLRNGVELQEAIKLLPGVALSASAAAVGEQDPKELFAPMADVATDIANIWGLSAEEASDMMEWMVAASARSKFDLLDMAYAVSRGGPGASMAGMSATDFFHMLATVAPQYQSGQMAGTNLASLITSMASLSKKQTDMYELYGFLQPDTIVREQKKVQRRDEEGKLVKDEEGEQVYDMEAGDIVSARSTLFDEQGQLLSPAELGQQLQDKLGHLPPDLLNEALSVMFGTFGKNLGIALMRAAEGGNFDEVLQAMESVDVEKMAVTRSGSIQSKEVVLGGKLTGISSFMGKDPAKLYRAFIEAADSLATGVLEGMQDREAEKSQQRQLMDAFNNLPLQLQEQEILSGFNPQTGLYDQERALQPVQTSGLGRLATETLYKGRSLIQDPEGGEVQKILGEQIVQAGIEMLIAAQMMENAGNMLGGGEGEPSYNNVAQIIAAIWQDGAGLPSELQDEMQNQRSIGGDGSTGGTGALGGPGSYVVVRGDTLGEIAKENDLTLKELMKLNPDIIDQDVIEVGEAINLPGTPQPAGSTLDGYYPGQSVPTRPGRPGTLPGGTPYPGQAVPVKIVEIANIPAGTPYPGQSGPVAAQPSGTVPSGVPYPGQFGPVAAQPPGTVPSGVPYPGQSGPTAGRRFAPAGTPSGFNEDAAQGVATFVQLFTGLLSGSDVPLPVSPDLDNFIAEIANAQFPAIEIDVIPRFNWEGGNMEGPPPNTYWWQGQGGTKQGPAQGPQTQADRSDDRRHSNTRTVVRADVDEGGSLRDPLGAPTFGI